MKFIHGKDRNQTFLFPVSVDDSIDENNEVRILDLFVDSLNLKDFGFITHRPENGRPAYHPKVLLKLFIYGYMNKIRSSRDLEKETKRNIEVMWLLYSLSPDHNTISNFRRDNPKAIKKVFRATVQVAKHFNLIGGTLIAGDSTKLRAQNSKKNNFNQKKIERHVEYIDKKLEEYSKLLSVADDDKKGKIKDDIDKHQSRKDNYKKIEKQINESGEVQVSTSDPESRQMITRNNITEVAYNVQTTVDSKHNIPFDYKVTNSNDSKAMGIMLRRAKSILRSNDFTALYDKGYHTGSEFKMADNLGVDVMVAIPAIPHTSQAPNPAYNAANFIYNKEEDYYICPQNNKLITTGKWHKAETYHFKRYTTKACRTCKVKEQCSKAKYGKAIQRSEFTEYIANNKERIEQNEDYYRKRQAIVEHPYGTIKRQWGFDHIMTKKTMKRASADVGFIFTAYNLRRIINIIGINQLMEYFRQLILLFFTILGTIKSILRHFKPSLKANDYLGNYFKLFLKRLIFGKRLKLSGGF